MRTLPQRNVFDGDIVPDVVAVEATRLPDKPWAREIAAWFKAAAVEDATVHDVVYQMREAALPFPRQPREIELAEPAKARKMLGLTKAGGESTTTPETPSSSEQFGVGAGSDELHLLVTGAATDPIDQ